MSNLLDLSEWSRKHTLVGVFLLMLLVAGYYFGHQSFVAPAKEVAAQVADIPAPKALPDLTEEDKAAINAAVPVGASGDVAAELVKIAEGFDVRILSLEVGELATAGAQVYRGDLGSESYNAELSASTEAAVEAFLLAVSENPRYIRVDSVRVMNEDGVRLNMGLTVFYQQ